MDKISFFIKLNEICENYLTENKNSLYIKNLNIYGNKAMELLSCNPLECICEEEKQIDLLDGINIIYEYLKDLNSELSKKIYDSISKWSIRDKLYG